MAGARARKRPAPRSHKVLRWVMAGPLTLLAAILTMASTPLWFPKGVAGIDHLIFSILLFPMFWAFFIFYSLIEPKPVRGVVLLLAFILLNALVIYLQFSGKA